MNGSEPGHIVDDRLRQAGSTKLKKPIFDFVLANPAAEIAAEIGSSALSSEQPYDNRSLFLRTDRVLV